MRRAEGGGIGDNHRLTLTSHKTNKKRNHIIIYQQTKSTIYKTNKQLHCQTYHKIHYKNTNRLKSNIDNSEFQSKLQLIKAHKHINN